MTENTRVCPFCGAKNQPEARFCGYCGGPMEGAGYRPPTAAMPDEVEPPLPPNYGAPTPPPPQNLFEQTPLPPVSPPSRPSAGAPIPPPPYSAPQPPMPSAPRRNAFLIPGIVIFLLLCGMCACLIAVLVFSAQGINRARTSLPGGAIQAPGAVQITPGVLVTVVAEPGGDQRTADKMATEIVAGLATLSASKQLTPEPVVPPVQGMAPGKAFYADDQVTFVYDESLASGVNFETVPETKGADVAPWDVNPEYQRYTLEGYPLQGPRHRPQIFIYPVAEYVKLAPEVQKRVDALKKVLQDKPADVRSAGELPFLPFWNAAPVMVVQVKYFTNGVRFITKFAQDISPVTNQELFYTYQGLSADGKYYVAVILPVSTPLLPETTHLTGTDYDQFIKDFQKYMSELVSKLNGELPAAFTPNLGLLDDFVQSIEVN